MSDPDVKGKDEVQGGATKRDFLRADLLRVMNYGVVGTWDSQRCGEYFAARLPEIEPVMLFDVLAEVMVSGPKKAYQRGQDDALAMIRKALK